MSEPTETVEEYIRRNIAEMLKKTLDTAPWWCIFCGEGGNYDGERPDEYWIPPESHKCSVTMKELRGILEYL